MKSIQYEQENNEMIRTKGYGPSLNPDTPCQKQRNFTIGTNAINLSKWTDGLPYERSRRMKHQIQMENEDFSKTMESTAYASSLHHDEDTWDILNQSLSGAGFKVSNKREELGDKLANREMVQQIGFNPFLGQTNYVDDISIRDQYLKPINTTQGEKTI
jgi:hypothetical protein